MYKQELESAAIDTVDVVNSLITDWSNAPEIKVYDSFKKLDGVDSDALGVYREDGSVALNTEALIAEAELRGVSTDDMIRSVVFHESLGHHGLAVKFGEELDYTLNAFYEQGSVEFRTRVDDWMSRNPEAYGGDRIRATEEVLAELSEAGELPVPVRQVLINKFKEFARNMGISLKYSDDEIRAILGVSQRTVSKGPSASVSGAGQNKYMVTYHGSGADFDQFDHSYMSSGEGNQLAGWGTYLSESKGIAKGYRDAIGGVELSYNGVPASDFYAMHNAVMDDIARTVDPGKNAGRVFDASQEILNRMTHNRTGKLDEIGLEDAGDLYDDMSELWSNGKWSKKDRDEFVSAFQPMLERISQRVEVKSTGKLYKVELPDDAQWLEWETPVGQQPHLEKALIQNGYIVTDYPTWNYVNRDAALARLKYDEINARLNSAQQLLESGVDVDGVPVPREELAELEARADKDFEDLQLAAIERNKQIERASKYFYEDMTGADVYNQLSDVVGSPKDASMLLNESGIGGNRFLANNVRSKKSREEVERPVFNYVVFDDKVPVIKNKYMRPTNRADDSTPIRKEDLTPDELFESLNALEILDAVTRNHQSVPMSLDDLANEAALRGVTASEFLRRNVDNPGELTRKMYQYDIAAQKLDEKLAGLNSKINSGRYTMKDKKSYVETLLQFEDLTSRIFDAQSEAGRVLRAIQEMQYTKKRVTTVRDLLSELGNGMEGLDDPATFEKFARSIAAQLEEGKKGTSKNGNQIIEAINIPRALMSSYDLSAPLRQGLYFINMPQYWTGFARMFTYWGSKRMFDNSMREIASRPTYAKMNEANLAFSRIEGSLSSREEDFQTDLAKQIPLIGRGVEASERAYVGFLNKLRADMFDQYLKFGEMQGVDIDDPEYLRGLAKFINAGTGRGDLSPSIQSMAPQLNALLFSPRLISSRLSLLNPLWYAKLPPGVRGAAIASSIGFGSTAMMSLWLLQKMLPEVSVESDPRSADFGKVRWGNTRYDVLGGFGQYVTLGARLITGQKATSTGEISEYKSVKQIQDLQKLIRSTLDLEEAQGIQGGPYQQNIGEALESFGRNKSSPNASYVYDSLTGENAIGEDSDMVGGIIERLMPMYLQDIKEAVKAYGVTEGLVRSAPGMFGVGSSTYVPKSLDPDLELEAPHQFKDSSVADGSNEWVVFKDGIGTLTPGAREEWQEAINAYFTQIIEYEMSQVSWEDLEPKEQASIIKEARAEARREAKKDMERLIGVK